MSMKQDYYRLRGLMRGRELMSIYWLAQDVDYEVFKAVAETLNPKEKYISPLTARKVHYKASGNLVHKAFRV